METTTKVYRVFNKNSLEIEVYVCVVFDESILQKEGKVHVVYDDVRSPRKKFSKE